MSIITDVIKALLKRLIDSRLFGDNVYTSVLPATTLDWFPACAIIAPRNITFRRSSAQDGGALGAMSAAPIFQLADIAIDIIIKTAGMLSNVGSAADDMMYEKLGHFYYVIECMRLINGLRIRRNSMIINPSGIAISSVDPVGRFILQTHSEREQPSRSMHGMEIESVIHIYTVVEVDSYSSDEMTGHIIDV